jgi:hypothetical protein
VATQRNDKRTLQSELKQLLCNQRFPRCPFAKMSILEQGGHFAFEARHYATAGCVKHGHSGASKKRTKAAIPGHSVVCSRL